MDSVLIKPQAESALSWLEREASSLPVADMSEFTWDTIDVMKMPVCLISSSTGSFAYVLYNRKQFALYREKKSDGLSRAYYLVEISKLWEVSNLSRYKALIEDDRHLTRQARMQRTPMKVKQEVAMYIAEHLNRDKSAVDVATEFGVSVSLVNYLAMRLKEKGLVLPSSPKGVNFDVIMANLKKTKPELFPNLRKVLIPVKGRGKR